MDYCNSILYGIDAHHIARLQRIQNSAARLVTRTRKHEHITPILIDLHWLPIPARIEFKILMNVFKILHNSAPSYLSSLVKWQVQPEPISVATRTRQRARFSREIRLEPGTFNQRSFGARSFSFSAPLLWNDLPNHIRTAESMNAFKSSLKTYLFTKYYDL